MGKKSNKYNNLGVLLGGICGFLFAYYFSVNVVRHPNIEFAKVERLEKANVLLLQSRAEIYTKNQQKPPKVFSDYIEENDKITPPHTMLLQDLHYKYESINGIHSTVLTIKYDNHLTSKYYLEGSKVSYKEIKQ